LALGPGPADRRLGAVLDAGTELAATKWLAFLLEVRGGAGYRAALDVIALSAGSRLYFGERVGAELSGMVPVLGEERLTASVAVSLWYQD
jgi:hypothetical protein